MSEAEWLFTFDLHDPQLKRALPKSEIVHVVYSCGKLVVRSALDQVLAGYPDPVPRDKFAALMREVPDSAQDKDIQPALAAFDSKETGLLSRIEVQGIFTAMDEKISKEDYDRLMAEVQLQGENYSIEALTAHLKKNYTQHKAGVNEVKALRL